MPLHEPEYLPDNLPAPTLVHVYASNDMAGLARDLNEYSVSELVKISFECAKEWPHTKSTSIKRDLARIQSDVRDELKRRSTGRMQVLCEGWPVKGVHEPKVVRVIDCTRDQDGQTSHGMCQECEDRMRQEVVRG